MKKRKIVECLEEYRDMYMFLSKAKHTRHDGERWFTNVFDLGPKCKFRRLKNKVWEKLK